MDNKNLLQGVVRWLGTGWVNVQHNNSAATQQQEIQQRLSFTSLISTRENVSVKREAERSAPEYDGAQCDVTEVHNNFTWKWLFTRRIRNRTIPP